MDVGTYLDTQDPQLEVRIGSKVFNTERLTTIQQYQQQQL